MNEIQVLSTVTSHTISEVQLLFLYTSFQVGQNPVAEVQNVTCDATGGTFTLTFNGYTTAPISFDASSGAITSALNALPNINVVTVHLVDHASKACTPGSSTTGLASFQVIFNSVVDMNGNLPLLTADTNHLQGASFISIHEAVRGAAGLGGTYRLSFRGSITQDIPAPGTAQLIQTQLNLLDSIPSNGVIVTQDSTITHANNRLYRITFVSPELGGNLDELQVVQYYNKVSGSDASITVFHDGLESTSQRDGSILPSIAGNQLGGNFTITYRGYTTDIIDYDAADTVLKSRLEALPNIGSVSVTRTTGPSVYGEYTWTITFTDLPGVYPPGTGNASALVPHFDYLLGSGSQAIISIHQEGSPPLGGTFALTVTTRNATTSVNISETAAGIPADASASEVESFLNALTNIGTVSVSRTDTPFGYQWLVTFNGCKVVNGTDVCNEGDIPLIIADNSQMVCASNPISVSEIVKGSGPDFNCGSNRNSLCAEYFTSVQSQQPYSQLLSNLVGGTPYYAVISAHNSMGYGYPAVTVPQFQVPTFNPPGPPPAVRLVSSTTTSITVSFEFPRENGGAPVQGFHLYVDDWTGGNARLAFDGTDQPEVTQFTVTSSSSFYIQANQNYAFYVTAINYCFALNTNKMCVSEPSPIAIFTARNPRLPLAPPLPYLSSKSKLDFVNGGDVTIRWFTSVDNGGSPIQSYILNYAAANATVYTAIPLPLSAVMIDPANSDRILEYTVTGLVIGNVYRFYVVAVNAIGKSAASPILSAVVGQRAGIDVTQTNVYAESLYVPNIVDVSSTSISITWPMPPTFATGGIPITGYKVYMYPNAQLNTLAHPRTVFNEVQQIQTSVDSKSPVVITCNIPSTVSYFGISTVDIAQADNITFSSSRAFIAQYLSYLSSIPGVGTIDASSISNFVTSGGFTSFTLTLHKSEGIFDTVLTVHTTPITSTGNCQVDSKGTAVIGGSFALSFLGNMTVDLPYNVTAAEMKYALEDLPSINSVTVTRSYNLINGTDRHAYTWVVTFDGTPGNLPLLYASAGRLTPLESHVKIAVKELVAGTPCSLIYDGTGIPEIRYNTVGGLIPDMTYAFAAQPINALGDGIISSASATVVATSGASATYTTASGSSLNLGITANIDEQQVISLQNCDGAKLNLSFSGKSVPFDNQYSEAQMISLFESKIGAGAVDVTLTVNSAISMVSYLINFHSPGDIPMIIVNQGSPVVDSCTPAVTEFVKGRQNSFTIEPKTASGDPLTDTSIAAGFAGKDIFLVETYYQPNGSWYRDQGVAVYVPQTYTIQAVKILKVHTVDGIQLYFSDYLTPFSTAVFQTPYFTANSTAYEVQAAIESLPNVDSVDVVRVADTVGDVTFLVTFLSNLGSVPLFTSQFHNAEISLVSSGVCEVQTVTIACDDRFTREVKVFTLANSTTAISIGFLSSTNLVTISKPITALKVQNAINSFYGPNGSPVVVSVSLTPNGLTSTVSIIFFSPVGPVGTLFVNSVNGGSSQPITVIQVVKGVSPTTGTFTIAYGGQYTADIDHDASSAQVKNALESLSSIGTVAVARDDLDTGYRWTISFTNMVGNLPLMVASDYRYEIQRLWTEGGTPTPLSGMILIYYGNDSTAVNYDATASELEAALTAMPSIGAVEVSRTTQTNGQFSWLITFRGLIGQVDNLGISNSQLLGSSASVYIQEVIAGSNQTLFGPNPTLTVYEKVAGKPDYSAVYTIDSPGSYSTVISQLVQGGLIGQYFDNQWFYGSTSIERVDSSINFDWSSGYITPDSSDYVSIIWSGKLVVPKTDVYTFYMTADDSAVLTLNHSILINGTDVCCIEHRASILLVAGVYYDFNIAYVELTGSASINLKYSSSSILKQIVPPSLFYTSFPISGSPYSTQVLPGTAAYPFTDAYGVGLSSAITGKLASFFVQTKDSNGNNQTTDYELTDPTDVFDISIVSGPTIYNPDIAYVGNGLFYVTYTPLKAGNYYIQIQMGDRDIYCGRGEAHKCSPFALTVNPSPTVPSISEIESPSGEAMDYLVEAVAGEYGVLYIQAKDAFGNNQNVGGDKFSVKFINQNIQSIQYAGKITDNGDGTYTVRYTIPVAGYYSVLSTLATSNITDEFILSCVAASAPFIYSREYNGLSIYKHPNFCSTAVPTLHVVHNDFSADSSDYDDSPNMSLTYAEVGTENSFIINSRDKFGNLRFGDNTTHFSGYGDGKSDYFLVEFSQPETGDYYRRSTAIDTIVLTTSQFGYFKLSFGGRITDDIPSDISNTGLEAVLEKLHDFQLNVIVSKSTSGSSTSWTVEFLTMLNVWQSRPPSGLPTGQQLTVLPGSILSVSPFITITKLAAKGVYKVFFTLWLIGTYNVRITSNGVDILGSPVTISVTNAPVDPTASFATGPGLGNGIAGVPTTVFIQAIDKRQTSIQYIVTDVAVPGFTPEIQEIILQNANGATFFLSFRGAKSAVITTGTSRLIDLQNALNAMGTLGAVEVVSNPGSGSVLSDSLVSGLIVRVVFSAVGGADSSVVGNLPLLISSDPNVLINEVQPGYAPFRQEVQVISSCSLSGGQIGTIYVGNKAVTFANTDTVATVANQFDSIGYSVSISSPTNPVSQTDLFCKASNMPLFVKFTELKGAAPILTSTDAVISQDQNDGALEGLWPVSGTFSIGVHGENTTELSFDASSSEVATALEALYSVGSVTVTKDSFGLPLSNQTQDLYPYSTNNFLVNSVWTVSFTAICTGNLGGVASGNCPASIGDEPLFFISTKNLQYNPSPYVNQAAPRIHSVKSLKGYPGNVRQNYDDLYSTSLTLVSRSKAETVIDMNAVQNLKCQISSNGSSSKFDLQFLNNTIANVSPILSPAAFVSYLQKHLDSRYVVSLQDSTGSTICSSTTTSTKIIFSAPSGTTLPLIAVINAIGVNAAFYPYIQPIDSLSIVRSSFGLYSIVYTPTIVDSYDIFVQINGQDVSTDLTAGITVSPALEYAATSTHNISQVNIEGVREYFAVQLRDRFGNPLMGPMNNSSQFLLSFSGNLSQCQSNPTSTEIPVFIDDRSPYTDGLYSFYYDPTTSGSYLLSVKLLTAGGLLGTYYKRPDLTIPILASSYNLHDGYYHNPYWCDGLQKYNTSTFWTFGDFAFCDTSNVGCGCDSTKLDTTLYFDWGASNPLPMMLSIVESFRMIILVSGGADM